MMDALRQDIGFTIRMLRKHAGFTLVIIAVLGLGIGGSTAIFSVVNSTLLQGTLLKDIDRMVRIDDRPVGGTGDETNISPFNTAALIAQQKSFDAVAVQDARTFVLTGSGDPQRLRGAGVSAGWNDVLGVQPVLGRAFTPAESADGRNADVVLIGYTLWHTTFGGRADVLGRTITLNGRPRTVVGVMPAGFRFPYEGAVWTPIEYDAQNAADHYLLAFGRLRRSATLAQVQADLDRISQQLPARGSEKIVMRATPLRENLVRGYDRTALTLLAVVGFLLLLACVNVSGLMLARIAVRRQEMIIRASLGASRARQIAQLITETTMLSIIGSAAGLGIALLAWPYLGTLVPPVMTVELAQNTHAVDVRVLVFTAGLATITGIAIGLLPALRAAPKDLGVALREGGRTGSTRTGGRILPALVVSEIAIAMTLLLAAGAVVLGFRKDFGGAPGYNAENVLTMGASLSAAKYPTFPDRLRITNALLQEVKAVPGVVDAAFTTTNPRLESWDAAVVPGDNAERQPTNVQYVAMSPRTIDVMQMSLREGRAFADADNATAPRVLLVSRSLANRFWPGTTAVGRTVRFPGSTTDLRVVGVVNDVRYASEPYTYAVYTPYAQLVDPTISSEFQLMVKTKGNPTDIARAVQQAVWRADPDMPLFNVASLTDVTSPGYVLERTGAAIGASFGMFSLILAAFGVFGILSFMAGQRRRDNAIRIALGASPARIGGRMFGEGALLIAIGATLGMVGGVALTSALRARFNSLGPVGQSGYATLTAVLGVSGLIACVLPVRRVIATDPMSVLRED